MTSCAVIQFIVRLHYVTLIAFLSRQRLGPAVIKAVMASQTLVAVLFFLLFALRSAGYHQKVSPSLQSAIEASFGDELKRSVNSPSPSKIWVDFSSNPRLSFDNMVKSVLSVDGVISERVRY